jgi:hypothetical protein
VAQKTEKTWEQRAGELLHQLAYQRAPWVNQNTGELLMEISMDEREAILQLAYEWDTERA